MKINRLLTAAAGAAITTFAAQASAAAGDQAAWTAFADFSESQATTPAKRLPTKLRFGLYGNGGSNGKQVSKPVGAMELMPVDAQAWYALKRGADAPVSSEWTFSYQFGASMRPQLDRSHTWTPPSSFFLKTGVVGI